MLSPDDLQGLLIAGTATWLANAGLGTWDDFGDGDPYTLDSEWPIYQGPDAPDSPDRIIIITNGPQSFDGPRLGAQQQIRLRGADRDDPRSSRADVDRHAERIRSAFRPGGRPLVPAGGLYGPLPYVGRVEPFGSSLALSRDPQGRHGFLLNIRIRARWTR